MIDFEILPADGPGVPAAVLATGQYADKGITFNGPVGLDYSRGGAIPGFAHSGTKAIEPCYGREFCTTPIALTFSVPQQRVKVWVGYRARLDAPRAVVLVAYDAAGAEVARATDALAPSAGPQPIRLPLEVRAPAAAIASAEVRFTPPTTLTSGLAVDDVEFDSAGSATCASRREPFVTLDAPADGSTTQTNQLLVSGSIDAEAPLEEVLIVVDGTGGKRIIDLLAGGAVGRGGGAFGPVRITGLLFAGANTVSLIGSDCHGGELAQVHVTYDPISADARFALAHIEVTQSVQDEHNGLPLIADKRTLVRAYLRATGSTPTIRNVRGTLTACRPAAEGAPICGDFFPKLYTPDAITVDDSSDLAAQRGDLNGSLNFELPRAWSSAGLLHLQIADLEIDGLPAEVPCDGCDNPNVFGFPGFHQFKPTKPLSFLLFEVEYEQDGVSYVPRFTDVYHLRSWLERAYPTSRVIAPNISFSAGFDSVPSAGSVNAHLYIQKVATRTFNALIGWFGGKVPDSGVYYGMLYDGGIVGGKSAPYFVPGSSIDSLGVGMGPTGMPKDAGFGWDTDPSYGDWYGGHEIGHLHGREHPGFVLGSDNAQCVIGVQDSSPVDGDFPYANGSTGNPGWDAGDAGLGIPARIQPPYTTGNVKGSTDVMTYCNYQWISDYTYRAILHRIDSGAASATLTASEQRTASDALVVSGTINLTRDVVELAPFMRLADVPLSPRPPSSPFTIDLLDGDGALLARYPFEPARDTEVPVGADATAVIGVVVPFDPATRTIVIAKDGVTLGARSVSLNAPSVRLLSPNGGETLQGPTALVTWAGVDLDGDALRYTLLYSTDAGATWFPVAVNLAAEATVIHLDTLPGSTRARLRVIASDGVNTSMDDSDGVLVVPPKAPEVRIVAPASDAPLSTRQTVVFTGDAFDREDGDLDDAALRWTSDRQGVLGTGRSIAIAALAPGRHVVTLEATDSDGLHGAAQVVIDVVAELPHAAIAAARSVPRGSLVDLDAGGSSGVDGLTYRWAVATRPAGSDARLLATDGTTTALQTDVPGVYEVELIVRDGRGNVAVARVPVVARPDCIGDCDGDGEVTVDELLLMVNIALGNLSAPSCGAGDANHDAQITIDEILLAVSRALSGCTPG